MWGAEIVLDSSGNKGGRKEICDLRFVVTEIFAL